MKNMRFSDVVLDIESGRVLRRFNVTKNYKGPVAMAGGYAQAIQAQILAGPLGAGPLQTLSAVGANVINPVPGLAMITAAGIAACTLALPIAGTDDGKILTIISTTANAHTVTTPAGGLNKTLHIGTFAATVGAYMLLVAFSGTWYCMNVSTAAFAANVTLT